MPCTCISDVDLVLRARVRFEQAALGESPVTAGDKVLLLQPGRADAARCLIDSGRVPGGVLETHMPRDLVVQAADAYGNLCLSGGEEVGVLMKGGASNGEVLATEFEDRDDGTYVVPVTADSAGVWSCQVRRCSAGAHQSRDFSFLPCEFGCSRNLLALGSLTWRWIEG